MSAGIMHGEPVNSIYTIRVYDPLRDEILMIDISKKQFYVWDAAVMDIPDERKFLIYAEGGLIANCYRPGEVPKADYAIEREIENIVESLVELGLMYVMPCLADDDPNETRGRLAVKGSYIPTAPENNGLYRNSCGIFRILPAVHSLKTAFMGKRKTKLITWISDGYSVPDYLLENRGEETVGEDLFCLLRKGFIYCIGWEPERNAEPQKENAG